MTSRICLSSRARLGEILCYILGMLLRLVVITVLFTASLVRAQEMLVLSFAEGRSGAGKIYGSEPVSTLSVVDGQQVILQKSSGRDYRLQASALGRAWTQVQQVPRNATAITVTPHLSGEQVLLEISYSKVEGDEAVSYSSSVKGELGGWISLLQSAEISQSAGTKSYSTKKPSSNLSVKVDRAR